MYLNDSAERKIIFAQDKKAHNVNAETYVHESEWLCSRYNSVGLEHV